MDSQTSQDHEPLCMQPQTGSGTYHEANLGEIDTKIHYTTNESNNLPRLSDSAGRNASNNNSGTDNVKGRDSPYATRSRDGASTYQDNSRKGSHESLDSNAHRPQSAKQHNTVGSQPRVTGLTDTPAPDANVPRSSDRAGISARPMSNNPDHEPSLVTLDELSSAASRGRNNAVYETEEVGEDGSEYASGDEVDDEGDCGSEYSGGGSSTTAPAHSMNPKPFNKKNLKRHRLSHGETRFLLNQFGQNPHPDAAQRTLLAKQINGLTARQIQVWFQNRRAKLKRMSAADADRMLSTRSYPEGYGPQGFENRAVSAREGPQNSPYVQPVEGVYASNAHDYQNGYHRGAPAAVQHYLPENHGPPRNYHPGAIYASPEGQGHPHGLAHTDELAPNHYDALRAAQMAHYEASASSARSQYFPRSPLPIVRSPVSSHTPASPLEHAYGRPLRSPSRLGPQGSSHRPIAHDQAQYPRSTPIEPGFISVTESSSSYLQPPYTSYAAERDAQNRSPLPRYASPMGKSERSFTGSAPHTPNDVSPISRYPGQFHNAQQQPYYGSHQGPIDHRSGPHAGLMERSRSGDRELPAYSDMRHLAQGHGTGRPQYETRPPALQRDQHFYYGSEEHIRHEKEELENAQRAYAEQQERAQLEQESYTPNVPSPQGHWVETQSGQGQQQQYVMTEYARAPVDAANTTRADTSTTTTTTTTTTQ